MSELYVNKKYILKVCQLLYSYYIAKNRYRIGDLYHDYVTYETIFKDIQKNYGP
jgi:hypothetical protein